MAQIFGAQGNQEKKKQYIYEAKDLAKTALDLDDQCANAHKWLVFTILAILFFVVLFFKNKTLTTKYMSRLFSFLSRSAQKLYYQPLLLLC